MKRSKTVVAGGSAVLILTMGGGAAYLRFNGDAEGQVSETAAQIDSIARLGGESGASSSSAASDIAIPVEGATVLKDTMVISVSAAGEAAAWRQALVSALVQGKLDQIAARENTRVAPGALLAAIDPAQYQLDLDDAQANLRKAQATYNEMTLFDEKIEDAQVRAERARNARSKSGLDNAELALERAKLNVSRARSLAPFAGRVASIKVSPGQWVNQGNELMTIVDINRVKVEVQVLESEIGYIATGRKARVQFAAFPAEVFEGVIETINPLVDKTTRTAKVVVSLPNSGGRILPGMYARVSLDARRLPDRLMVPRTAILERDGGRKLLFVFEETSGSRGLAKWRYVSTGAENETMVEILPNDNPDQTVRPGEVVLTGGHHTLTHDARIRIVQEVEENR